MTKYRVIYYDTETTGLPQHENRRSKGLFNEQSLFDVHIIELAAYDPKTKESFNELAKPPISIPEEATAIHNITNEMVATVEDYSSVGQRFIDWLSSHTEKEETLVLIAHNGNGFDNPLLMAQCKKYGLEIPSFKSLDSLPVFRGIIPKNGEFKEVSLPYKHRFKLTTLASALMSESELSSLSAHRALDDVKMLCRVFEIITEGTTTSTLLRSYGRTYKMGYQHAEISCNLMELPPIAHPPLSIAISGKHPLDDGVVEGGASKKARPTPVPSLPLEQRSEGAQEDKKAVERMGTYPEGFKTSVVNPFG